MANWEADDYDLPTITTSVPVIASKGKWEGEDEEDEDIPDEWDAESEDEKPKSAAAPPPPKPKKSVKQAIAEREERERKEAEEKAARRAQGLDLEEADEDPRARREREHQAELEADMQAAKELFASTSLTTNGTSENDVSNFRPGTKDEFDEFARRLTAIITSVSNMPHYAMFIAGLVKSIAEPLGSDDVKKVTSGLTALGNEKLKAEKGPGGKKKAAKKPVLSVGAAKTIAPKFDTQAYGADDEDFDDFM